MRKPVLFRVVNNLDIGGVSRRLQQLLPLLQDAFEVHVATYHRAGALSPHFREMGIAVHHLPLRGKWNPAGLRRLARLLREHRAAIVHTHSFGGNISGILAATLAGVPVRLAQVHTRSQHWYGKTELRRKKQRLEEYLVHSLCTHAVLFASPLALEYFASHCPVSRKKLLLLHNGIRLPEPPSTPPPTAADIRRRYGIPPERRLLGLVGRLTAGKGVEFAVRFLQRARAAGQDYGLLILGKADGPEQEARYRALGESAGGVCFAGLQEDPYPFYRCFDGFFFPSESWTEAMPGAVLEAAAHGLPILARENPAVREIAAFYPAIHFMADADDPVLTLDRLFALPPADTRAVADNFSIRAMADKTLALYDRLLSEHGGAGVDKNS
ncbi:MAG: glycosyltransferase family 4 protein [Desulfovibrio sp.]|nr:glycosyltransferase family 4 protein [Desulfovibrio sp.]